jgi:hypothetical protein
MPQAPSIHLDHNYMQTKPDKTIGMTCETPAKLPNIPQARPNQTPVSHAISEAGENWTTVISKKQKHKQQIIARNVIPLKHPKYIHSKPGETPDATTATSSIIPRDPASHLDHTYMYILSKPAQAPDTNLVTLAKLPTILQHESPAIHHDHNYMQTKPDKTTDVTSETLQRPAKFPKLSKDPAVHADHSSMQCKFDQTVHVLTELDKNWTTVVSKKQKRKQKVTTRNVIPPKHPKVHFEENNEQGGHTHQAEKKRPTKFISKTKANDTVRDLPDLIRSKRQSSAITICHQNYKSYNVPGDGNCFFHCLSLALHGHTRSTLIYRRQICQYIHSNWDEQLRGITLHHELSQPTSDSYWTNMVIGNGYATVCEVEVATIIFGINITLFLEGTKKNKEICFHEQRFQEQSGPTIKLLLKNNHYYVLQEVRKILTNNQMAEQVKSAPSSASISSAKSLDGTNNTVSGTCSIHGICTSQTHIAPGYNATTETASGTTNNGNGEEPKIQHRKVNHFASQSSKLKEDQLAKAAELLLQSRKLGVSYEFPSTTNETVKEQNLRSQRNIRKIKKQSENLRIEDLENIPDPPPQSDDEQFNNAMNSVRAFELEQMSYTFKSCDICHEVKLNMRMASLNICHRCQKDKEAVKMFSTQNQMDPGIVPPELSDLTMVEQQLISRISPCINVHMLSHGGIAANGHCVTFPQAIEQPAKIFPKLPSEINIIKVRKEGKNNTSKDFAVRRFRVQSALQWLKNNNPVYLDIIISEDRLSQLPINGEIQDIHTVEYNATTQHTSDQGPAPDQINPGDINEAATSSGVLLPEPPVDIREKVQQIVEEVMGPEHGDVTANKRGVITIPWPSRDNVPMSEFTTNHFFTLAFPNLFPYSTGDFCINRRRTCTSMAEWAEHLIWYRDGRFARHEYFKFIVHNMIMRKRALENCSFIVQQKLGDEHLTISALKEKLEKGDNSIAKKILYFGACLRGTSQYWAQRSKELQALIQFQANEGNGLPSFFTTGSCAEYYFKPLRRLLQLYIKQTSGKDIDIDDRSKLFRALQENTHIVGYYFDLRTRSYFERVMRPVFGVNTFWYRQEFAKSRGMIHWHGLCWRSDREPHNRMYEAVQKGLSEDDTAQCISDWAKSVFGMTATHPAGKNADGTPRKDLWAPPEGTAPAPPEEKNPLIKLLMDVSASQESLLEDHLLLTNRINMHRCSDYCLRRHKDSNDGRICRMEFGTESTPGKQIREKPAIVKDRNKCLRLEMERDHPALVQHSKYHTQAWRANGDISIILSNSPPENPSVQDIMATQKYVSGYACKGNEPTGAIADLFADMINTADDETPAKSLCTKLLMQTVKRDISAVEATYELSALPLYRCSHQFQTISMTGSRILETTGKTLTKSTPLDRYLARDENDISSWYNYICRSGRIPVVAGSNVRATWPLHEEYCRTMLLLHWPNWREIKDIKSENLTWTQQMECFLSMNSCPNFVKADVERTKKPEQHASTADDEDNDELYPENDADTEQPEWMNLIRPNTEYEDISDFQYDDGGAAYDWSACLHQYPQNHGVHWLKKVTEDMQEAKKEENELKIPNIPLTSMNRDQRFAFNLIMKTLFEYKNDQKNFNSHLRLIVAGTAGSGKSFLVKGLVKAIRTLFQNNKAVQVLCPTGSSANNISGVTIHSFLKVPTNAKATKEMIPPDGCIGASLQRNCESLVALLVDERSLVGSTTLGWMEFLCSYGIDKGSKSKTSWGGLPVVVFLGDDVQLPPVCDSPVYRCKSTIPAAMHGALVWKEFTTAITLKTLIRQNKEERQFTQTLSALRQYQVTRTQAEWLQNFQWNNLRMSHGEELLQRMSQEGLFVFPTHEQESSHNKLKLLEANKVAPIAKIQAHSQGVHKNVSSDKAGGLLNHLYLCRGAKVMLTTNMNVEFGLFNGSMGTVQDIIYLDGKNPTSNLPDVVMVEFSKYSGPPFIGCKPKLVPIVPVERKIDCHCFSCKRTQVPLRLGWGTTIHRCQGMTIGRNEANRYIIISPGTCGFESRNPGALFVALSRAKTAGHQGTDPDFAWHPHVLVNEDRLCHIVRTATTSARTLEINRIETITEDTKKKFKCLLMDSVFQQYLDLLSQIIEE